METRIFNSSLESLKEAAELIEKGHTVIFPTETVYGLGANALSEEAVMGIYAAKGRPSDNPLIVHIAKIDDVYYLASEVTGDAKKLMDRFWPGPLTIILKKKPCVPDVVSAGLDTVGIRMPENETAREFIRECKLPIAAPSANISGKPSPTTFEHVFEDMNGRVSGIIKGEDCGVGVESTVIDMSGGVPTVLRPGGISVEQLSEVLGEVKISSELKDDGIPKAPGMKYKHYSPKAQVYIVSGSVDDVSSFVNKRSTMKRVAVMAFDGMEEIFNDGVEFLSLGSRNNPQDSAKKLFACLREGDRRGAEEIYAPEIPDDGLWRAVKNRLYKAASGRILDAKKLKSILFVCTGNTCRSPMAEGIFNSLGKNAVAASAGLFAENGACASENAITAAAELGADIKNHAAKQLTAQMIDGADLVLTMTKAHKMSLPGIEKVKTLAELVGEDADVCDPYGGDVDEYRRCAAQIKKLIEMIDL